MGHFALSPQNTVHWNNIVNHGGPGAGDEVELRTWNSVRARYDRLTNRRLPYVNRLGGMTLTDHLIDGISAHAPEPKPDAPGFSPLDGTDLQRIIDELRDKPDEP